MSDISPTPQSKSTYEFLPLPKSFWLPKESGNDACPLLEEYIDFSKCWSPRSYHGFHEACGLWVLSTIAANRVSYSFGGKKSTSLMIGLIGPTGLVAKTTAARNGVDVLRATGLDYLLLPDTCTPQKLVSMMTNNIPPDFGSLSREGQDAIKQKLAFSGQRGWFHDEFSQLINGMMRLTGPLNDFRSLLRLLDDNIPQYEKSTIARDREIIVLPYLALLGNLTPACLAPYAYKGSPLWGDGFLARFALIASPQGYVLNGKFPLGDRIIPASLISPLTDWHKRLGIPKVDVQGVEVNILRSENKPLEVGPEVRETYYAYDNALREIIVILENDDLAGSYIRFPGRALRIAALFASLQQSPEIKLNHLYRSINIVEGWRSNLHDLYSQVAVNNHHHPTSEEKTLRAIDAKGEPTKREIEQFTGLLASEVQPILDQLVDKNMIQERDCGRTIRYKRVEKAINCPPQY